MGKSAYSIQVIDRLVQLLDVIKAQGGTASLKVLSAETDLHTSTVFRILSALSSHEFVARDSDGQYLLGRKLRDLGSRVVTRSDLRGEAREIMAGLCDQVGETVNLTVREEDEVVYVERVSPNRMMRVEQVIGSRAPLHVTAVGKLMLSEFGSSGVRAYAKRTGLPAYTPNTLTTVSSLMASVTESGREGIAMDSEEAELGVGCIGVLIRDDSGAAVAGLSVSAPIGRLSDTWRPLIRDAAWKISLRLGYQQPAKAIA